MLKSEEFVKFIESWGTMGVLWGINRSMARIHAFMILSENPVDLDEISKALYISRGNASMCLKELRNWGVIQRVHISGERRDFYVIEPDVWKMFFRIAVERKKREFDPALDTLRQLIAEKDSKKVKKVSDRLQRIEETFSTFDRILNKFLENEKTSRIMIEFFKNFAPR
ncbi:MAG: transcriptional regulator [Candidatus Krumholzibacteriota bacterium]|nr:transcriptional regulator [Candidatus Krumholzibacteriota bacterium]